MTIEAAVLLQQWLSPAFPIGAFAYSHGLEAATETGRIRTGGDLDEWLRDLIEFGAGRSDPVFLAAAYRGDAAGQGDADAQALAFQPSKERRLEMEQQGMAFARTLHDVWHIDLPLRAYPVVLGAAARAMKLPLELTTVTYVHAFISNLIAAAQRLLPIGQAEGQRILVALGPDIRAAAVRGLDGDLDQLASATFLADIAAMQHETQYSRIFRS